MNENQNLHSENVTSNRENQSYQYVFSMGAPTVAEPPRRRQCSHLRGATALVLCLALSFVTGFGGAWIGNRFFAEEDTVGGLSESELYHNDPAQILDKDPPSASLYGSAGDEVFTISQVVQQVEDSVVVINVTAQYSSTSSGSGVIISENGYILTCHHVVDGATSIVVTLNSGSRYAASLVGSDERSDLAVIRIQPDENEPLTYASQGSSADLVVGERVVAIGNPLGTLGGTVTDGIISATEREIATSDGNEMTLLQTNAAINQGNSGGGLFNLDGKLIGIVNAKYAATGVEGLAFAIPIDLAYTVQLDLIKHGYVRGVIDHGLSVQYVEVTSRNQTYYKAQYGIWESGVYVLESEYCNDLTFADRILSVNGIAVNSVSELEAAFEGLSVGDRVTLAASRNNQPFTATVVLQEYVPDSIKNKTD